MDTFTELELCFSDSESPMLSLLVLAAEYREDSDAMRELVDADSREGYGGYCIIA